MRRAVMLVVALGSLAGCGASAHPAADAFADAMMDGGGEVPLGACQPARAVLMCTSAVTTTICLSDDAVSCRPSDGGLVSPVGTCSNQCASNQTAFLCGCIAGCGVPAAVPPGHCPVVLNTAAGLTFYCCDTGS